MQQNQDKDANQNQPSEMRPTGDSLEGDVIHEESTFVDFEEFFVGRSHTLKYSPDTKKFCRVRLSES